MVRRDFFQLLIQLRNTGEVQEEGDWNIKATHAEKLLSLDEMSAQAFFFFVAGYESTSTTMTFCMYELARNPALQQKAFEEIQQVLANHDGVLNYDSLGEMKYLKNCILGT